METEGQRNSSNPSAMLASLLGKREKLQEELRSIERQMSNNHHWMNIPQLNKDFIDLCLTQIATCGYQGTSLKPYSWKIIRETLSATYPDVFNQVGDKQKFIKHRWNRLRKKYTAYRLCMNIIGNVYSETTGHFTFTDEQWKTLYKQNPDTLQFKTKPLEYRDEMYKMFEGVLVTREDMQSHTMMNNNYVKVADEVEGFTQDPYFEGVGSSTTPVLSTPTTPLSSAKPAFIPSSGTSKSSKRKRVEPMATNDHAIRELISMLLVYF